MKSMLTAKMDRQHFVRYTALGFVIAASQTTAPRVAASPGSSGADTSLPRLRTIAASNGVDDRAAIQAVLDEGAGEVVFPAGQSWTIDSSTVTGGLSPRSDTRIIIEEGAVLKVRPNAEPVGRLIDIGRDGPVRNVSIEGSGTLLGDALVHQDTTGEWGHLIHVTNGSADVRIIGPLTLREAWGDGIYIGDGSAGNRDVLIDGVIVDDCRREGIAPFWVDGCTIRNCRILDIGSTLRTGPSSGIDCEPNAGQLVRDLTIEGNVIDGAAGCGIYVSANPGPVDNLVIRGNTVIDCGRTEDQMTTYQTNGIHVAAIDSPLLIDNVVRGSGWDGKPNGPSGQIYLRAVNRGIIRGGNVSGGLGPGILATHCTEPMIVGVMIEMNQYQGVAVHKSNGAVIRDNHLIDNVQASSNSTEHLLVQASDRTVTEGNVFRGDRGASWVGIEEPGIDNFVANNAGLGAPPMNMVIDTASRTVLENDGITVTE